MLSRQLSRQNYHCQRLSLQQEPMLAASSGLLSRFRSGNGAIAILSTLKLNAVEAVIPAELPLSKTVIATGADAGRVFRVTFSILKTDSNAWGASERELFYLGIWQGLEESFKNLFTKKKSTWARQ